MKIDNNRTNRAKFHLLYAFQAVGVLGDDVLKIFPEMAFNIEQIVLRSIHSLTDDEYVQLSTIMKPTFHFFSEREYLVMDIKRQIKEAGESLTLSSEAADYLRSISVLVPYKNLTMLELLGIGWVKLKKEDHA